ncbi:MAG: FG-GAP-like repeat-containing protein [Candidatus Methylumidiphilus sp.]
MDYNTDRYGTQGDDVFDNRITPVFNTFGHGGNDYFITDEFANFDGGGGNDTIIGGVNGATAIYWDSPSSIYVDLLAGYADDGWGTRDTLKKVTCIQASSFSDTLLGDGFNNQFWPASGHDFLDGRGGVDQVTVLANPLDVQWSRIGDKWNYKYTNSSGEVIADCTLQNIELVNYYFDQHFSETYRLRPDQITPSLVSFDASAPTLDTDLIPASNWRISQFGISVVRVTESYPAYYYPTSADYHDPGIFNPNPHNAVVGDFNGDGKDDIWVNWVAFPHTVARQTALGPTVLMGSSSGLLALPSTSIPTSLDRHMAYRTMAADFNGDGIDDVAFGGMGIITRLPGGGFSDVWEKNGLALFNGNTVTDGTALLEAQGSAADLSNWGFAHDGSAGDINGDGRADLYAGGRLWVSNAGGSWDLATQYLPPAISRSSPMSSAIGDLDGDTRQDIVVFWPDFSREAYAIMSSGQTYPNFTAVALPPLLFGENSKANNCAIADLNGDGLGDIVVATTRAQPYYQGAALQLLMQTTPGHFEDQTSGHLDSSASDLAQGEGQLRIVDANGDGLIDIVHSIDSRGANIFLNDGTGHFTLFDLSSFPFVQSSQIKGLQTASPNLQSQSEKLYPIDLDGDGLSDFLSYLVFGDYQTHAGNIAVLYTVLGNELAWGRQKSETLNGTGQSDFIRGYGGNDSISGTGGNDTIDGGNGTDTALFSGNRTGYAITKSSSGFTVSALAGSDGTDTLQNVERIRFADGGIALDVGSTQSAGQTVLLLGAVLPGRLVFDETKQVLRGAAIDLFDQGYSLQILSGAVMRLSIWDVLTGTATPTNTDMATYLLANVNGVAPDATTLASAVTSLNAETSFATQGNFLWHLAESSTNQIHVGLVGLASTGLAYAL